MSSDGSKTKVLNKGGPALEAVNTLPEYGDTAQPLRDKHYQPDAFTGLHVEDVLVENHKLHEQVALSHKKIEAF